MASKLSSIIGKLKRSPLTVIGALLGAVLILSAVAVASVMGSGKKDGNVVAVASQDQFADEASRFAKLQNDIKALLFDSDVDRNAIEEQTWQEANNSRVYTVKIGVRAGEAEALRQAVVDIMNANKFAPLYTTAPYHLVMSGAEHRYELLIEEAAGDDIAVVVPADNSSLPVTQQPAAEELVLPPKGSGKIALLIDDGGMNLALAERLLNIGVPVALAILPHLPHSGETAALVHEYEQTVFLHFPMEPLSYPSTDPGQGAVLVNMPELLIEQIVKQNVENLGGLVDGYNNHMGSALTEDATKMAQVFEHMKPYSTNFVDSNTSAKTVALATCQETAGYKCGLNRKFLDNENDHGYIRQKLYEMAAQSNKGGIITIGHLRPDTIAVLEEVVPQLQALGYQFVPITSLME